MFGKKGKIRLLLLERAQGDMARVKAAEVCRDVGLALRLWDGAFAAIHTVDPTDDDCDKAQECIDMAMKQVRAMGISIKPKMHAIAVRQMRAIPGGISKLMEHWVEQYHQIGYWYDQSYC